MAAGLAEEELQGVGGRLDRRCGRCFLLLFGLVDELEAARLQLALQRLDLERRELVWLEELGELEPPDRPGRFRRVEERTELLVPER